MTVLPTTASPMIAIPDSLAFFWGDRANRAAVDVLLGGGLGRPAGADLAIDELEAFETARLAAFRVRHDLWRFLRSVWGSTWGAAIRSRLPHARLLRVGEHDLGVHGSYAPTLERGWEDRQTFGLYALTPTLIAFTSMQLEQDDRIAVFSFSMMDTQSGEYPSGFEFPMEWSDDGQGWGVSGVRLPLRTEGDVDLQPARDATAALVAHVSAFLGASARS